MREYEARRGREEGLLRFNIEAIKSKLRRILLPPGTGAMTKWAPPLRTCQRDPNSLLARGGWTFLCNEYVLAQSANNSKLAFCFEKSKVCFDFCNCHGNV